MTEEKFGIIARYRKVFYDIRKNGVLGFISFKKV